MNALSLVQAADEPDLQSPIINFDAVDEGLQGDSQVFTVFVTDAGQIEDVSIYYRMTSDSPYNKKIMSQLAGTDIYKHTILTSEIGIDSQKIEYYIRARDQAGNLTLEGFSFDPIVRTLLPVAQLDSATEPRAASSEQPTVEPPVIGMSTSRKWLYGALGVVLVGALLSSSGGSGGGGAGAQADAAGVSVTVVVDPLASPQ